MPNRSELAVRAMPSHHSVAEEDGAWAIFGLCVVGSLVSIYFAANFQSFDGSLIAQIPWG